MSALPSNTAPSRKTVWAGRALTFLAGSFLTFDTAVKLLNLPVAVQANAQLGYPEHLVVPIGLIELACAALFLLPHTSLVGAVLMTGYLGGAVATQLRVGNPLATHVIFPFYVAALIWGGLLLRDARLRACLSDIVIGRSRLETAWRNA